jgi:hypothetical protein
VAVELGGGGLLYIWTYLADLKFAVAVDMHSDSAPSVPEYATAGTIESMFLTYCTHRLSTSMWYVLMMETHHGNTLRGLCLIHELYKATLPR